MLGRPPAHIPPTSRKMENPKCQKHIHHQVAPKLHTLPIDILRKIVSYLDVSHLVSLAQVNRFLRETLINDMHLWTSRLQAVLKSTLTKQRRRDPFGEILKRIRTHRCAGCKLMEDLRARPYMDPFFNVALCEPCRRLPKYLLVTSVTAKKRYFLNDDDLLKLKTISRQNPHSTTHHTRLYSLVEVERLSSKKLALIGTTKKERRQAQKRRRMRGIVSHRKKRLLNIVQELAVHGFQFTDTCLVAKEYIRHWPKRQTAGLRRTTWLTVADVVAHFYDSH